jgi:hypothetical protein
LDALKWKKCWMIRSWKEEMATKCGGFKRIKIWMKDEIEPSLGVNVFIL